MQSKAAKKELLCGSRRALVVACTEITSSYCDLPYVAKHSSPCCFPLVCSFISFREDGSKISLQLWDIAGHERFGHMTHVYYKVRRVCGQRGHHNHNHALFCTLDRLLTH